MQTDARALSTTGLAQTTRVHSGERTLNPEGRRSLRETVSQGVDSSWVTAAELGLQGGRRVDVKCPCTPCAGAHGALACRLQECPHPPSTDHFPQAVSTAEKESPVLSNVWCLGVSPWKLM